MPINYQAPQAGGSFYQHAASNFSPANASLIGHEEALGQQQTLQNQRLLFEGGQQAAMEAARIQAAGSLAEQHAQLQVWVHGQEMTQAEQMQLKQDQNAVAWINSQRGKSLTNAEADQAIGMRVHKINLGQQRLQMAEAKQKAALAGQEEFKGKLIAAQTDLYKKSFPDRVAFHMDETQRPQIESEVDVLQPGLRQMNPDAFEAAVKQRAEQSGAGTHFYQEDVGKWKPIEKGTAKGAAATAAEKLPAGALSESQYTHVREATEKSIKHDAEKAEQPVPSGNDLETKVQEEMRRKGFAPTLADHKATLHPKEQQAAQAKEWVGQVSSGFDAKIQETQARPDVPPELKSRRITLMAMAKQMVATFGPHEKMKADAKKRYDALINELEKMPLPPEQHGERTLAVPAPPQPGFGRRALDLAGGIINDLRPAPLGGGQ